MKTTIDRFIEESIILSNRLKVRHRKHNWKLIALNIEKHKRTRKTKFVKNNII